jgi:hypothetical protein
MEWSESGMWAQMVPEVRGWEKASDHAPTWIVIDEGPKSQ